MNGKSLTNICVTAETREWTTRERDHEDEWDAGDTAGEVSNVVAFVESTSQGYYGASHARDLPVEAGDTVWAVVADYESGCTFGRSGGHADVMEVFASAEEAETFASAAMVYDGPEDRWGGKSHAYGFEYEGKSYSRAWVGHFESLNSVDVWECVVKRNAKDPWTADPRPGYKRGY